MGRKSVLIRPYRDGDAPAVAAIIARCVREINSRDYPPEIVERMCAHFTPARVAELAGERQMVVAETDAVIGTVSRAGNKVYSMFVLPEFIGRGIGRDLMNHIENLAAADGHAFMETGASITAHGFYQRLGYTDIRTSETEFGLNYILRKPLNT
jgi:GNAT superfamily N-acetyltransferase